MEINRMDEIVKTCSGIILREDFEFPGDLTEGMRSKLILTIIKHFQNTEDYEKCARLKEKFSKIIKKDENTR